MTEPGLAAESQYTEAMTRVVRTSRIITIALALGVVSFAAVAILSDMGPKGGPGGGGVPNAPAAPPAAVPVLGQMSLVAVGMMVVCGMLATVVPRLISRAQVTQLTAKSGSTDASANKQLLPGLLQTYQTQHIVRAALVEGPAFMGLFAYMSEGHNAVLVVPAVSVALLLATFPSVERVARWMELMLERP